MKMVTISSQMAEENKSYPHSSDVLWRTIYAMWLVSLSSPTKFISQLPRGPLADVSVVTDDGFGAGHGYLSPTNSVADLGPNRDAAVDKFSVSISSFLLKMGSLERPLQEACTWMRTHRSPTTRRTIVHFSLFFFFV